jgi:hypothetical protein
MHDRAERRKNLREAERLWPQKIPYRRCCNAIDLVFLGVRGLLRRHHSSLAVIFFQISASYGYEQDRATHLIADVFADTPSHINAS